MRGCLPGLRLQGVGPSELHGQLVGAHDHGRFTTPSHARLLPQFDPAAGRKLEAVESQVSTSGRLGRFVGGGAGGAAGGKKGALPR